jgi:hypothetical protein
LALDGAVIAQRLSRNNAAAVEIISPAHLVALECAQ